MGLKQTNYACSVFFLNSAYNWCLWCLTCNYWGFYSFFGFGVSLLGRPLLDVFHLWIISLTVLKLFENSINVSFPSVIYPRFLLFCIPDSSASFNLYVWDFEKLLHQSGFWVHIFPSPPYWVEKLLHSTWFYFKKETNKTKILHKV